MAYLVVDAPAGCRGRGWPLAVVDALEELVEPLLFGNKIRQNFAHFPARLAPNTGFSLREAAIEKGFTAY
jgi:hypothetical protein